MGNRAIPADFAVNDVSVPTTFIRSNDFAELLEIASAHGYNEIMVEAGSHLGTAIVKAGLIDELHLFIAPKLLGGGTNFLGEIGVSTISEAKTVEIVTVNRCGNDVEVIAVINNEEKVGE